MVEHVKGAPFKLDLALLVSILLSWKDLPGTHYLAYYEHSFIVTLKSFVTLALGRYSCSRRGCMVTVSRTNCLSWKLGPSNFWFITQLSRTSALCSLTANTTIVSLGKSPIQSVPTHRQTRLDILISIISYKKQFTYSSRPASMNLNESWPNWTLSDQLMIFNLQAFPNTARPHWTFQ